MQPNQQPIQNPATMQPNQQPIQQQPPTDAQFQQRPTGGQFYQQATPGQFQGRAVAGGHQQAGVGEQFQQPSGALQAPRTATRSGQQGVAAGVQDARSQQSVAGITAAPVHAGQEYAASDYVGTADPVAAGDPSLGTSAIQQPAYATKTPTVAEAQLDASKQGLDPTIRAGYAAGTMRQRPPASQVTPVQQPAGTGFQEPIASRKTARHPSLQQGVQQPLVAQGIPGQFQQGIPQAPLAAKGIPQQSLVAERVPGQSLALRGIPQGQRSIPRQSTLADPSLLRPTVGQQFAGVATPAYGGPEMGAQGGMNSANAWRSRTQLPAGQVGMGSVDPSLGVTPGLQFGGTPQVQR
jgi:hypothetical protein